MNVKYQGMDLLETIAFVVPGLGDVEIQLKDPSEKLDLVLEFRKDDSKPSGLQILAISTTAMRITMTNWDNPFGTTFRDLIKVGTFRNRALYFILSVSKAGSEGQIREVVFSAYLGEEITRG